MALSLKLMEPSVKIKASFREKESFLKAVSSWKEVSITAGVSSSPVCHRSGTANNVCSAVLHPMFTGPEHSNRSSAPVMDRTGIRSKCCHKCRWSQFYLEQFSLPGVLEGRCLSSATFLYHHHLGWLRSLWSHQQLQEGFVTCCCAGFKEEMKGKGNHFVAIQEKHLWQVSLAIKSRDILSLGKTLFVNASVSALPERCFSGGQEWKINCLSPA